MSSTSSLSDSESEECESHHHKQCVPVPCYYPAITQPLVYFSEVQRKTKKQHSNPNYQRCNKVKPQNKKTCFRRAFEWYTKGRSCKSRQKTYKSESRKLDRKRGQCICETHDFDKFAEWLDGKYEEYLKEQRCNKFQERENQRDEDIKQSRSCVACNVDREKHVSYIMEPNPLVKAASDSCTRGKSTASEITIEPSRKNMCRSQSASSVAPSSPSYVPIDECGPENCPYRYHPTPAETKSSKSKSNVKNVTTTEPNKKMIDCRSVGINCCECELGPQDVSPDGKSCCVCPTCCNVDSCVVNNLGTLIRTEKPYTVFVNDRSQTSDHSIKLDKDATGCYPFYMRIVCPDKLETPCVCDYCP